MQAARTAQLEAAADAFVDAVDTTSVAFAATDHGGAHAISGSVRQALV
jgi:hypothetical protein